MNPVFIIAEAGVNHNGNLDIAEQLVDAAVKSGADAIKFQAFTAGELVCGSAPMAEYQIRNTARRESQFDMLKRLELDRAGHQHLKSYCRHKNISFMSSPFDLKSIDLLASLDMDRIKIPSGEINNVPYLEKIGNQNREVILSTGMADMDEVVFAAKVLEKSGTDRRKITLLHCCSQYPAPMEEVNLSAIISLSKAFPDLNVGYSDHTLGIEAAIASVAIGARVIEKHFTLDRQMPGPDHLASLEPDEFTGMVCAIRNIEKAMGHGEKRAGKTEIRNRLIVRKSIVARTDIRKGEIFTPRNLAVKRPGDGLSPVKWYDVLGRKSKKDFLKDEQIAL